MTSLFLNSKTKNRRTVFCGTKNNSNGTLMSYTRADFDGAVLSSMLILNWNKGSSRFGAEQIAPPLTFPFSATLVSMTA